MYRIGIAALVLIVSGSSLLAQSSDGGFTLSPKTPAPEPLTESTGSTNSSQGTANANNTGSSTSSDSGVLTRASGILTELDEAAQDIDQTLNVLYQKYAPQKSSKTTTGATSTGTSTTGSTATGATTTGATAGGFLSALLSLGETAAAPLLSILETHDKKIAPEVSKFAAKEGKVENEVAPVLQLAKLVLGTLAVAQSGTRGSNEPSQDDWKEYIDKNPAEAMVVLKGYQKLQSSENTQQEAAAKEKSAIMAGITKSVQLLKLQSESKALAVQSEATAKRQAEIDAQIRKLQSEPAKPETPKPGTAKAQ